MIKAHTYAVEFRKKSGFPEIVHRLFGVRMDGVNDHELLNKTPFNDCDETINNISVYTKRLKHAAFLLNSKENHSWEYVKAIVLCKYYPELDETV